jgi:hypothetical protein
LRGRLCVSATSGSLLRESGEGLAYYAGVAAFASEKLNAAPTASGVCFGTKRAELIVMAIANTMSY